MAQENITFYEYGDGSYNMVDLYLYGRFFDVDVDKILVYKKSNNEYVIRYNNANKRDVVPLQLKMNNFYCNMHRSKNNSTPILIKSLLFFFIAYKNEWKEQILVTKKNQKK